MSLGVNYYLRLFDFNEFYKIDIHSFYSYYVTGDEFFAS